MRTFYVFLSSKVEAEDAAAAEEMMKQVQDTFPEYDILIENTEEVD